MIARNRAFLLSHCHVQPRSRVVFCLRINWQVCAPVINRQIGFAGWARVGARSAGLYLTCTRVHLRATTYLHLYKRRYDTRLAELDELSSPLLSSCGAEGPANNESRDFTASRSATAKMPRNSGFEPLRRAREGEEATLSLSLCFA